MPGLPVEVAAVQQGLLTGAQLREAGLTRKGVRGFVTRGDLQRLTPSLYRLAGTPVTTAQRLLAAVLEVGDGAALSHTSALAWWKVPGFLPEPIHVSRCRDTGRRRHQLADHVHMVTWLPADQVYRVEDVPVVAPTRALFELAGQPGVHPGQVERAIDNAWAQRLVTGELLHEMMALLHGRRWPGMKLMRRLLRERGGDYVPPASGLEGRVVQILRQAGEPPLRRQFNCGDRTGWIARVDFIDGDVPFILEVQSDRYHSSLLDQKADQERFSRLEAAGYVVATVTETDVWHRPANVLETVTTGRQEARDRLFSRSAVSL